MMELYGTYEYRSYGNHVAIPRYKIKMPGNCSTLYYTIREVPIVHHDDTLDKLFELLKLY